MGPRTEQHEGQTYQITYHTYLASCDRCHMYQVLKSVVAQTSKALPASSEKLVHFLMTPWLAVVLNICSPLAIWSPSMGRLNFYPL